MQEITQSELKELLHYDQFTGVFTWLISTKKIKIGDVAGCVMTTISWKKYQTIRIKSKGYLAHRLAVLYMTGIFPPEEVDHVDGDGLNNIYVNLRSVTRLENGKNQRLPVTNTSGFIGVCWHKMGNKWCARIKINGKQLHLGLFTDIKEAIQARQAANIKHGFHINHGQARPL